MNKFKKGNYIVATKSIKREVVHGGDYGHPAVIQVQEDNSHMNYPEEILHVSSHHYTLKGRYGSNIITFDEVDKRAFVRATKKMVELMKKDG